MAKVDILDAQFVTSLPKWKSDAVQPLPQFCFAGRSNVGKSSLLNCLVARKALARTSNTPGRTQALNVFEILMRSAGEQRRAYFVDLPGYGFARAPKSVRETWGKMIEGYFRGNRQLRTAVMLFDIRHDPSELDLQLIDLLAQHQVSLIPVATKSDKVGKSHRARHLKAIAAGTQMPLEIIRPFSSQTREGRDGLLEDLFELAETETTE